MNHLFLNFGIFRDHPYVSLPLSSFIHPEYTPPAGWSPTWWALVPQYRPAKKANNGRDLVAGHWKLQRFQAMNIEKHMCCEWSWGICQNLLLYRRCVWFSRWIYVNYLGCSSIHCLLDSFCPLVGLTSFFWILLYFLLAVLLQLLPQTRRVLIFCETNILAVASTSDISIWCWWRNPATSCNQIGFKNSARSWSVTLFVRILISPLHNQEHTYNVCIYIMHIYILYMWCFWISIVYIVCLFLLVYLIYIWSFW